MFPETFETDRLRFERLCRETVSVEAFYSLVGASENPHAAEELRYIPREPVDTLGAAADRLRSFERQWDAHERAEYAIRPRTSEPEHGDLVGTAGLIFHWDRRVANPAIRLRRAVWGRGYSGERADALLALAFERFDLECVAIPVHAENERSRCAVERYVERHGGRHEGLLHNDGTRSDGPVDRHRFTVTREEYEASK